jgi:hypothetical protein
MKGPPTRELLKIAKHIRTRKTISTIASNEQISTEGHDCINKSRFNITIRNVSMDYVPDLRRPPSTT